MKRLFKALLAGTCFVLVSFMLVNGTFALPDLKEVFQAVVELGTKGLPEIGGQGTAVHVAIQSDDEQQRLFPGGAVSKTSAVKNLGTGDVFFRLVYAIQYDAESWKYLDIDFDADEGFARDGWKDINVSGTKYKMMVFTYKEALEANEVSPKVKISIDMDAAVNSEQLSRYRSDFLKIKALAIDPAPFIENGFTTAEAALDKALPIETLNPF